MPHDGIAPALVRAPQHPPRAMLTVPPVAWPTLLVAVACLTTWVSSLVLGALGVVPLWLGFVASTLAAYVSFTPVHDATHRSIGRRRWLSEVIGRLLALPLMGPFPAFKYVHLEHHKHVNEDDTDPDHWAGRGRGPVLLLRWLTQDAYYYWFVAKNRRDLRRGELMELVAVVVVQVLVFCVLVAMGFGVEALVLWVVPARIATAMLAYTFDYLPHVPHETTAKENRYRATHAIDSRVLDVLFLQQNLHLIHHLYPGVPWYRYREVYRHQRPALEAKGARLIKLPL